MIGEFLGVACPNACLDLQEVFGCYLLFCVCLCVLFCMSEEMRPMKLFVLGFRVVAHISMLPVRGAHASVFPHPLFSFCVLIVTFPPGVIRMNL